MDRHDKKGANREGEGGHVTNSASVSKTYEATLYPSHVTIVEWTPHAHDERHEGSIDLKYAPKEVKLGVSALFASS